MKNLSMVIIDQQDDPYLVLLIAGTIKGEEELMRLQLDAELMLKAYLVAFGVPKRIYFAEDAGTADEKIWLEFQSVSFPGLRAAGEKQRAFLEPFIARIRRDRRRGRPSNN